MGDLLARVNGEFADPIRRFLEMDSSHRAHLAKEAPAVCQGGAINDAEALERCISAICAAKSVQPPAKLWNARPPFYEAVRPHMGTLQTLNPQDVTAFRYHVAKSRADKLCKDPPNDGNRAPVTEHHHAPVADRAPLAVTLLGLAALAAVRLGSLVRPEFRSTSPALIQGIYLWMGLTPPEEHIAPPTLDGRPLYNRYSGA